MTKTILTPRICYFCSYDAPIMMMTSSSLGPDTEAAKDGDLTVEDLEPGDDLIMEENSVVIRE